MGQGWEGRSRRDRVVTEYVGTALRRRFRPAFLRLTYPAPVDEQQPVTLVLGPRGSGKSTLLRHLRTAWDDVPASLQDVAVHRQRGATCFDVLAEVVFDLHARKRGWPRLTFPSFGVQAVAIRADVPLDSRKAAARAMVRALAPAPADGGDGAFLGRLVEAAGMLGVPAPLRAPLLLVPGGRRALALGLARLRLGRALRDSRHRSYLDYLVDLKKRFHDPATRRSAEQDLARAFLDDLCRAYGRGHAARVHDTRCLVLLDNAEHQLGGDLLELLLDARQAREEGPDGQPPRPGEPAGRTDPLVVLAAAAAYPKALKKPALGYKPEPGRYPGWWDPEDPGFRPKRLAPGLCVGQLRDLRRDEVEAQALEVLRADGSAADSTAADGTGAAGGAGGAGRPGADDASELLPDAGVKWLGWAAYEVTRGHPLATRQLFDELLATDDRQSWETRIQRALAPDSPLVTALLERLLPRDARETGLWDALPRCAAATDLARAVAAGPLWEEGETALRNAVGAFSGDVLQTMHVRTRDSAADGPLQTLHPLLRLLLLRRLEATGGWRHAHEALRRDADERGLPEIEAYHRLALEDLHAAARFLNDRFGGADATRWCRLLVRLRRAPVRARSRAHAPQADSPQQRYEGLLGFLSTDEVESRERTVTRLLVASWMAPEPAESPETDHVGDPYRNPLEDLYGQLYGEINARFMTLAYGPFGGGTPALLDQARQYEEKPGE